MIKLILTILLFSLNLSAQVAIISASGACSTGQVPTKNGDGTFTCETPSSGSIPAGLITFVITGACPTGWTEDVSLAGKTLFGTLVANADVGTTGGADSITPTVNSLTAAAQTFSGSALGTHSHTSTSLVAAAQTFTGSSTTVGAQTFTGDTTTVPAETVNSLTAAAQTVNSLTAAAQTFTGTPSSAIVNHVHVETINSSLTGATGNGFPALLDASTSGGPTNLWMSTANPTGGAATVTPAGTLGTSAVTGTMNSSAVTGTLNSTSITPLGHNSSNSITPLGSNASSTVSGSTTSDSAGTPTGTNGTSAVTGTLNSFDNRSSFVKVIFCKKT